MSLKIMTYGEPVLKKTAQEIDDISDAIKDLALEMFKSCEDNNGIGLAAPQINKSIRMFVLNMIVDEDGEYDDENGKIFKEVFINPVISNKKGKIITEEGCLSIPGIYEDVERAAECEVKYTDIEGNPKVLLAKGLLSRAIQHENDHLDGILFVDRLPLLKKQFLKKKLYKKYRIIGKY